MHTLSASIESNYFQVLERLGQVARSAGRDPAEVKLVVVTKGHPVEAVRVVIAAGARQLGENYVEEALAKIEACPLPPGGEWHMIGHVQSRKAREVAESFACLHSLDGLKLARRLSAFAEAARRDLPALLECNVSGEASKFGWPAWDESRWDELLPALEEILALPNLRISGLMTMAPYFDDPASARPCFRRLRRLRDYLAARLPGGHWEELSMGMSGDFEAAVQEGATLVRIGTAILGPRGTTDVHH